MANFQTLAITEAEYNDVIFALEHGFCHDGVTHRPNPRLAFAVKLEYATGMRISDIVKLRRGDVVRDGSKYRLDVTEQKTGKRRVFRISQAIYDGIAEFCDEYNIGKNDKIIGGCTYGVQKRLKEVGEYLGLERFSTHSIRKACACRVYEMSGKDVVAVQTLLQHSSPAITSRYLTSGGAALDKVLDQLTF